MAMTTAPTPSRHRSSPPSGGLGVSRYDQVAGLLVAVLMVFGFVTFMMFLIWLSSQLFWVRAAAPVTMLEDVGGGGSGQLQTGEREMEEPNPEELQELTEPPVEQSLEAISSIVNVEAEQLETLESSLGAGLGKGQGTGVGDGTGPGTGAGTSDGIPAWERWEIRMRADSDAEYAKQLDFFKVELGVAGGGNPNVEYVSNLASAKPTIRRGDPKDEQRLRFLHRSGELRQADRRLAAKAGVKTDGRVVFQFYDQQTYNLLLSLEAAKKGNRRIKDVRRTVFAVRGSAGRYEFYVVEQQYIGGA
jgi:hypothetical protein